MEDHEEHQDNSALMNGEDSEASDEENVKEEEAVVGTQALDILCDVLRKSKH